MLIIRSSPMRKHQSLRLTTVVTGDNRRFVSLMEFVRRWMVTTIPLGVSTYPGKRNIPSESRIPSIVGILSSNQIRISTARVEQSFKLGTPSMTTFKLLRRPRTTSRTCSTAMRVSAIDSLSNLCRTARTSLSSSSFFASFSACR